MWTQRFGVPVCFNCKRKDPIISEYRELEKKKGRLNPKNTIQRESSDGKAFKEGVNREKLIPLFQRVLCH